MLYATSSSCPTFESDPALERLVDPVDDRHRGRAPGRAVSRGRTGRVARRRDVLVDLLPGRLDVRASPPRTSTARRRTSSSARCRSPRRTAGCRASARARTRADGSPCGPGRSTRRRARRSARRRTRRGASSNGRRCDQRLRAPPRRCRPASVDTPRSGPQARHRRRPPGPQAPPPATAARRPRTLSSPHRRPPRRAETPRRVVDRSSAAASAAARCTVSSSGVLAMTLSSPLRRLGRRIVPKRGNG